MLLKTTEDFRSPLEKATRSELVKFAKARGVTEIMEGMPATMMRDILKLKGVTDIHAHFPNLLRRTLGQMRGVNASPAVFKPTQPAASQIDAAADMARQWKEQQEAAEAARVPFAPALTEVNEKKAGTMAALRTECKRRGIKMARTDKIGDLRAKLNGH